MADIDYFVIKIDKNDGSGSAPRYISNVIDGNIQLLTTTGSIVKKWQISTVDETDMDEMANLFHAAKDAAEINSELNTSRIYVDAITITE